VATLRDVVVDCARPAALSRFWAAVLDDHEIAPYTPDDLASLAARGITDVEDDPTVLVVGPPGSPRWFFVHVPEAKRVKNRVHVDLVAERPDSELARLTDLGATVVEDRRAADHWVVLADPEGNEFCLMF
jgi:hypothetical protein